MQTINISGNSDTRISTIDRMIRVAGGLNPTVSASIPPDQLMRSLVARTPTIQRSVEQPNGFFELDLGPLRLHWVICYDVIGSCAIFFVTHFDPGYGGAVMMKFIDEIKDASSTVGFEFGALSGPMYEAEPDICRILAQGTVA